MRARYVACLLPPPFLFQPSGLSLFFFFLSLFFAKGMHLITIRALDGNTRSRIRTFRKSDEAPLEENDFTFRLRAASRCRDLNTERQIMVLAF